MFLSQFLECKCLIAQSDIPAMLRLIFNELLHRLPCLRRRNCVNLYTVNCERRQDLESPNSRFEVLFYPVLQGGNLDKGGQNASNNAENRVEDCLDVHQQSANDSVQRSHEAAEHDEQGLQDNQETAHCKLKQLVNHVSWKYA